MYPKEKLVAQFCQNTCLMGATY